MVRSVDGKNDESVIGSMFVRLIQQINLIDA